MHNHTGRAHLRPASLTYILSWRILTVLGNGQTACWTSGRLVNSTNDDDEGKQICTGIGEEMFRRIYRNGHCWGAISLQESKVDCHRRW